MKQYRQRVSGPLLDRSDVQVDVPAMSETDKDKLLAQGRRSGPDSQSIREQVVKCRALQLACAGRCNARLEQREVRGLSSVTARDRKLLTEAMNRLRFSARAYFRILKIARTIVDLASQEQFATAHLLEAINYRRFHAVL